MLEISLIDLNSIKKLSSKRKVYIFTDGSSYPKIETLFYNIGIEKTEYITDDYHTDYVNIFQSAPLLLNRKSEIFIWLTEKRDDHRQADILVEKGFRYIEDFAYLDKARLQYTFMGMEIDPNLGFSSGDDVSGLRILPSDIQDAMKIAINGASLAVENSFSWKLWPELMQKELSNQGYGIELLMGATYGYTTTQCYLKLMRDILPASPDVVIDYSAYVNDCFYGNSMVTPYITGFQKKAAEKLKNIIDDPYIKNRVMGQVITGNDSPKKTVEIIMDNILHSMEACEQKGIKYFCVIPPSATFHKPQTVADYELKWMMGERLQINREIGDALCDCLIPIMGDRLIDARMWMDDYPEVFYDWFHMYENGNVVVAKKMMRCLYERKVFT